MSQVDLGPCTLLLLSFSRDDGLSRGDLRDDGLSQGDLGDDGLSQGDLRDDGLSQGDLGPPVLFHCFSPSAGLLLLFCKYVLELDISFLLRKEKSVLKYFPLN
jgi:hypothetical protein